MPDPVEPPPADTIPPVAPILGADPQPQPDHVPESVAKMLKNLGLSEPDQGDPKPKDDPKDKTDPPKPDAKKDPKPGDPPPVSPTPDIKLRKAKVARPELPIELPKAPVVAAKPEPYKADPQWESGLDETGREMLADAKFAEKQFPDQYPGLAARTAKFLKDHADLAAKDGFDAQSPEYKAWLDKNQPRLTREQIREIEETRVASRVAQPWKEKFADLQHKIFVKEHEPQIEREGQTIFGELSRTALPDDIAQAIKKDGYDKASEVYGMELQTAQTVLTVAAQDLMEFRRISTKDPETGRQLQAVVTDPSDPKYAQHQRLDKLVTDVCEEFKNTAPADQQQKNGKWFVTRDEWYNIRPDQRHRFWTFSNPELIAEAKKKVPAAVRGAIEYQRGQMKKLGWQPPTPKVVPAAPPKVDPPQPTNTARLPAAVPTPGPTDVLADVDARATRLAKTLTSGE